MEKTRWIPQGTVEYKPDILGYENLGVAYVDLEKKTAIFYAGKSSKHVFYSRFLTIGDMKKKINDTFSRLMSWQDRKVERAEARKAPTTLRVGDILDSSWGYDQTNVDFYLVTKVMGNRTVELRKVHGKIVSSSGPETRVVAVPESFADDKVLTKRVSNGSVHLTSYSSASLWDGRPKYETASGWGH
jgi:hypothetical protein